MSSGAAGDEEDTEEEKEEEEEEEEEKEEEEGIFWGHILDWVAGIERGRSRSALYKQGDNCRELLASELLF